MNKKSMIAVAGMLLAGLSGTAAANDNFGFSVSVGGPGYAFTFANPAPVQYYAPPVVYYPPQPVYYAPRAYYEPRSVVVYRGFYGHRGHGEHRGHH